MKKGSYDMKWHEKYGKIGFFVGLTTLVLLILGVRTILGVELGWKNYLAFSIFAFTVGVILTLLLFYKWMIAFWIFSAGLFIGFLEMYRNFLFSNAEHADSLGMLGLYSISALGCGLAVIVQLIQILMKRT